MSDNETATKATGLGSPQPPEMVLIPGTAPKRSDSDPRWVNRLLEDTSEGASETADPPDSRQGPLQKTARVLREEVAGLRPRLMLAQIALAPFPIHVGGRLRSLILKLIGFQIDHGTILAGMPTITGDGNIYKKLVIGSYCWINLGCRFNLDGEIRIGNHVSIGHDVLLLTATHEIGSARRRACEPIVKPVCIGNGAWIGSRSTILPGVSIGSGAVVAAGSVVHDDVAPNTMVGGVPARHIKNLP